VRIIATLGKGAVGVSESVGGVYQPQHLTRSATPSMASLATSDHHSLRLRMAYSGNQRRH
jgi:hypothetical protein